MPTKNMKKEKLKTRRILGDSGTAYYDPEFPDVNHRLDGPAVIFDTGTKEWQVRGELHRLDGPALEYSNGECEWFIQNKFICSSKDNTLSLEDLMHYLNEVRKFQNKK